MTIPEKKRKFTTMLFRWHKKNYRPMRWRPKTRDARVRLNPYRILVSEIMLQQTQVERVRTKYDQFLKKFPTVRVLAKAPLGDVLRVWSGLGYNRRAKFLHGCAKVVVTEYGAKFPDDFDELMKLPGIGRSTAGALLAFSFGHDTPMIDTNIRRILVRVFFKKSIPSDKELYDFAQTLIPHGKGRAWNYAMLDLGATLCTARNHSPECPLMKLHGKVDNFIYKKPQKKFKDSDRYYRGVVMRILTQKHSISATSLNVVLGISKEKTAQILTQLAHEKLISRHRGKLFLPR